MASEIEKMSSGYNNQSEVVSYTSEEGDKHEYSVGMLTRRVNDAMKWRKNAGFDEKWAKIIKLYANQYDYDELSGYSDIIAPNMMFSTANVIVPSVMVNYPKIAVTARKPEDAPKAEIVEAAANYYWQHYDFHDEVRLLVKDFVVLGLGVCKVTWEYEEMQQDMTRDEWIQAVQDALMEYQAAKAQAAQFGEDVSFPSEEDVIAGVPLTKMVVEEDRPCVERVSPFDVYIDPDATRIKNARWIAQRMYVPLEEARENE